MKSVKFGSTCIALMLVAGCSYLPSMHRGDDLVAASESDAAAKVQRESVITAESMIAQDFVNIMVQIEELSPESTVLSFGLNDSADDSFANASASSSTNSSTRNVAPAPGDFGGSFGKALRLAAVKSGYAVQVVDSNAAPNYVRFSVSPFDGAADETKYTYDLSVGDVDFRRIYTPLANGGVEPFKAMLVRGADATGLETDDSVFENRINETDAGLGENNDGLIARVPEAKTLGPASSGFDSPVARNDDQRRQPSETTSTLETTSLATSAFDIPKAPAMPVTAEQSMTESTAVAEPASVTPLESVANSSEGYQMVRKINIAVSGESNFENFLSDKEDVAEETLIFGDDSYVLGARNKKILGDMMGTFNPETDVISVIGCSTGVTKIENGNAALAIGRANRVKEALLYSGVPYDKIYDEGCWSPTPNSTPFPNRGVVITLKRNVKNG